MTRPLARAGIEELETLFKKLDRTPADLKALEVELSFRTTNRAILLLTNVQKTQRALRVIQQSKVRLAELKASTVQSQPAPSNPTQPCTTYPIIEPAKPVHEANIPSAPQQPTTISTAIAQAYQILKVSMTDSWEVIEQARREIVSKTQPDKLTELSVENRKSLQDQGKQANAAYRLLLDKTLGF